MTIKDIFSTKTTRNYKVPVTNTANNAGGAAYKTADRHGLAQFVSTGTIGGTFYASAEDQVDTILNLANKVDSEFLLKAAVYGRQKAFMKDVPSMLLAIVAARGDSPVLLKKAFPKVIDNGKMLRNFVQIIRSGKLGRSSFGTSLKKLIHSYLDGRNDEQLFKDSIGNEPTLVDIIKMVHPKPKTKSREALYGYLLGKDYTKRNLPQIVKDYEAFKAGDTKEVPAVDFRMLTSLTLTEKNWKEIAVNLNWTALRMNLNTLARHNAFDKSVTKHVVAKLSNPEEVKKARVFPYQLLAAYLASTGSLGVGYGQPQGTVPNEVINALQDAMEHSIENVPSIDGTVYVLVDTSGSMGVSVTGSRAVQSQVTCKTVAALIASTLLRKNPNTTVVAFGSGAQFVHLNGRDSIMTNAQKLGVINMGGTDCASALKLLNAHGRKGDVVIFASDNESWQNTTGHYGKGTATAKEWAAFKARNPKAKLVNIDLAPNTSTQVNDSKDILNIGGFSDNVFEVVSTFVQGGLDSGHWVSVIDGTTI